MTGQPGGRYCRPVLVENKADSTRIVCMCAWEYVGGPKRARRAYYQHQPDADPIPMRFEAYKPVNTEAAPDPTELVDLAEDMLATRNLRRWPDDRLTFIDRCPSCGDWRWARTCRTARCARRLNTAHRLRARIQAVPA